ncbi:hypothetical protein ACL02T_12650 [Pseudonocardia sp. RS010]|uniref:hypothetical protein n=1 Tax=Pseudonocardia sp. RS010 TaxID=3385979 RepID=UPI0039A169BE
MRTSDQFGNHPTESAAAWLAKIALGLLFRYVLPEWLGDLIDQPFGGDGPSWLIELLHRGR